MIAIESTLQTLLSKEMSCIYGGIGLEVPGLTTLNIMPPVIRSTTNNMLSPVTGDTVIYAKYGGTEIKMDNSFLDANIDLASIL